MEDKILQNISFFFYIIWVLLYNSNYSFNVYDGIIS